MTNRADLEALAVRLASMREFLAGSGDLDGAWFGDDPLPGMKGRFWWRKAMRRDMDEAISSLEGVAGLVDTLDNLRADLAEEDAELHAQRIAVIDETLATFREQGGR